MALLRPCEREVVRAIAALLHCNPFLPERLALERRALGDAFVPASAVWHANGDDATATPNAVQLRALVERLGAALQPRLAAGTAATAGELAEYEALVLYLLFQRYENAWYALIPADDRAAPATRVDDYERFAADVAHFCAALPGPRPDPAHLFALGFQARRAFHHIFRKILGASLPVARLRAAVWQSVFTDDVAAYRDELHAHMADIPTLIMGESGTGKELVARAIALSGYVPFEAHTRTFADGDGPAFVAVNLSALPPTLIEAELFGHRRGAFTGADHEHHGWFETCNAHGAVFLDEIGELDQTVQVKLLRVLQTRAFHRVGETTPRRFAGKLMAATHRNLSQLRRAGGFRSDLYYRLCGDVIRTPTLREQLVAAPDDWPHLVRLVAARLTGPRSVEHLARKIEAGVQACLPANYTWPGNMRELEQCARNILVRGSYTPDVADAAVASDTDDPFLAGVIAGTLTADELVQGYCARIQAQTGSFREAGRRLNLHRRTVAARTRTWTKNV